MIDSNYEEDIILEPMIQILNFLKDTKMQYEIKISKDEFLLGAYDMYGLISSFNMDLVKPVEEYNELQFPLFIKFNSKNISKVIELIKNYSLGEHSKNM